VIAEGTPARRAAVPFLSPGEAGNKNMPFNKEAA